jgi:inhibitor of KinA
MFPHPIKTGTIEANTKFRGACAMDYDYELYPLGDCAIVVRFHGGIGSAAYNGVRSLSVALDREYWPALIEYVPAFTTIALYYDPMIATYHVMVDQIRDRLTSLEVQTMERGLIVEIPVCYGGEYGPDLHDVADYCGLSPEEVIRLHSDSVYDVYMIGFSPAFPYMGCLPAGLNVPRRSTPRVSVPAGSVGLAGRQTGVYPLSSPGGWQLIGRTPLALFRPNESPPTLMKQGDQVRFVPIDKNEYLEWKVTL